MKLRRYGIARHAGTVLVSVFLMLFTVNAVAQPGKLRVGFLCPAPANHPFWGQVARVMQAVAHDLDIELVMKFDATRSTYATKKLGNQLLDSEPRLDYLITKYWPSVSYAHLQLARQRGIKVFFFNSDITAAEYELVGRLPREKIDNWIGHMVPDDKTAGYDLAGALLKRARLKNASKNDRIWLLALDSPVQSAVAESRRNGLKAKMNESPDAVLEHTEIINWEANSAASAIKDLLLRYPETGVIWTANEAIAWGAVQAVAKMGKTPGKDILIGGFDWNPQSIDAIADGRLTASMFGHFMEGGWALLMLYDYHHGIDFARDPGMRISTPLSILDADNFSKYAPLLREGNWDSIDFSKLSRYRNPELKTYNFSIDQFVR